MLVRPRPPFKSRFPQRGFPAPPTKDGPPERPCQGWALRKPIPGGRFPSPQESAPVRRAQSRPLRRWAARGPVARPPMPSPTGQFTRCKCQPSERPAPLGPPPPALRPGLRPGRAPPLFVAEGLPPVPAALPRICLRPGCPPSARAPAREARFGPDFDGSRYRRSPWPRL